MLSRIAYENKLKTTYGHVIRYFHKFSQTASQVLMHIDKLR